MLNIETVGILCSICRKKTKKSSKITDTFTNKKKNHRSEEIINNINKFHKT